MLHPDPDRGHSFDLGDVDPATARVFGAFLRATRLQRRLMLRVLAEHDTPPAQAMCLRTIAAHDGSTQREIGQLLHLGAPTVTAMLKRMERAGTIVREPDAADQRVARVRLTPAGRDLEREVHAVLAVRIGELLRTMPEADREELGRLLDDLADRMARALDAAPEDAPGGAAR